MTLAEIVVVRSTTIAADVPRRAAAGRPEIGSPDDELRLASFGFVVRLREVYRTSGPG